MSFAAAPSLDRRPERAQWKVAPAAWIGWRRHAIALALTVVIFWADLFVPDSSGIAALYGPVMLLALFGRVGPGVRGQIIGWSLTSIFLALVADPLSLQLGMVPCGGIHRLVSIAVVLSTGLLLLRDDARERAVRRHLGAAGERCALRAEVTRLQGVGALAATPAAVAHELNQPLAAIRSFCDAARRWAGHTPPDMGEVVAALEGLAQSVDHAGVVMHRVRALLGNAPLEMVEIDPAALLSRTVTSIRRDALKHGVRLTAANRAEMVARIQGDPILLDQVLVNLIRNAIEAMDETVAGERVVACEMWSDAETVFISVADRGPGWTAGDETKLFNPFFTTKANGMGLGLSLSRMTVERHGGSIALRSQTGGGAIVEVRLPRVPGRADHAPMTAAYSRAEPHDILLVA